MPDTDKPSRMAQHMNIKLNNYYFIKQKAKMSIPGKHKCPQGISDYQLYLSACAPVKEKN